MTADKTKNAKKTLLFADAAVDALEKSKTLPAKFERMLKRFKLSDRVKDRSVGIKMHIGADIGFTTIHPVFVRKLVDAVKEAGAASVKIIDGADPGRGVARGYTQEVLGCPVVNAFGTTERYLYPEKIGFMNLDEVKFGGEARDVDFFIDFAHVKGHGACGFGGALKNIAMGLVQTESRRKLHQLEGGLVIDRDKCVYCLKCFNNCPHEAIWKDDEKKEITFFFHNCTYCQHCLMICPEKAISMEERTFENFSRGMAMVTAAFLRKFEPEDLLFINVLTNITIYCDCWEFSTPSLVPDIGIVAGGDIAAVDTASLDMIRTENLLPNGLPKGRELLDIEGHLFEKIHAKNPYTMVCYLTEYYDCGTDYEITEVR
ncbi:MAG: DUF362 domain-containing protein [Candidatus Latescibacteria bacterium]|nr:DUF362 domain-containing protein [Candidatus Latescibacterota bacterium]